MKQFREIFRKGYSKPVYEACRVLARLGTRTKRTFKSERAILFLAERDGYHLQVYTWFSSQPFPFREGVEIGLTVKVVSGRDFSCLPRWKHCDTLRKSKKGTHARSLQLIACLKCQYLFAYPTSWRAHNLSDFCLLIWLLLNSEVFLETYIILREDR